MLLLSEHFLHFLSVVFFFLWEWFRMEDDAQTKGREHQRTYGWCVLTCVPFRFYLNWYKSQLLAYIYGHTNGTFGNAIRFSFYSCWICLSFHPCSHTHMHTCTHTLFYLYKRQVSNIDSPYQRNYLLSVIWWYLWHDIKHLCKIQIKLNHNHLWILISKCEWWLLWRSSFDYITLMLCDVLLTLTPLSSLSTSKFDADADAVGLSGFTFRLISHLQRHH